MAKPTTSAEATRKRRRADAERSVTAILDAAVKALASDPDTSMSEIARRAGVVRATIYAHFSTRDALLDAVMDHAIAEVVEAIRATEPERGEPLEAFARLLRAAWQELDRFHALVSVNIGRLPQAEFHRRHLPFIEQIAPLIDRGQKAGVFRSDLPVAWHLSVALAIVHAASGELRSGRIAHGEVEAAMISTTLAAVSERRDP